MKRTLALETTKLTGEKVNLAGWVNARRDHGGVIFIDLRDESGIIQLTVHPQEEVAFKFAEKIRDEYVLKVRGTVIERSSDLVNTDIATGKVEILVEDIKILNKSDSPPFAINKDSQDVGEEIRLKYRYLDIRREKMQNMLKMRAKFNSHIRRFMEEADFTEVATPILANSSPEGARDYLVPSRIHPGKFFALPQAPQQFKQLLMVGGLPRYYQIAPCFRDEDPRADRHPGDFYQLDMEMSFVEDGEEVRILLDRLFKSLTTDFAGKKLLFNDIPRITHHESINKYGTDKPDLRFGMELVDLTESLSNTDFSVFKKPIETGGVVKAICIDGGSKLSRKEIDKFTEIAKTEGAGGLAYITIIDGEIKSPIAKFLKKDELALIINKTSAKNGDAIFFGADSNKSLVNKVLGRLRNAFADHFKLKDPNIVAWAWIIDFPFYEWDDKNNKIDFGHNPFSMPKGGINAFNVNTDEERLHIIADQYDLVINGYEAASGAVRNYNPDVMYKAFETVGINRVDVDNKFGAMINAFKFGAPPHAGCAPGLDRIFMVLMDEPNIREVIAFPKNGSGIDVMMNSPSFIDQSQLDELSISISDPKE